MIYQSHFWAYIYKKIKAVIWKDTHTLMFIAVLFTTAKTQLVIIFLFQLMIIEHLSYARMVAETRHAAVNKTVTISALILLSI